MGKMWVSSNQTLVPLRAAEQFVRDCFAEPRAISWLEGSWVGKDYAGRFQLEEGEATYNMTYTDSLKRWEVSR